MSNFSIYGDCLKRYVYEDDCIVGTQTVIRKEEFIACYEAWIAPKHTNDEGDADADCDLYHRR